MRVAAIAVLVLFTLPVPLFADDLRLLDIGATIRQAAGTVQSGASACSNFIQQTVPYKVGSKVLSGGTVTRADLHGPIIDAVARLAQSVSSSRPDLSSFFNRGQPAAGSTGGSDFLSRIANFFSGRLRYEATGQVFNPPGQVQKPPLHTANNPGIPLTDRIPRFR